MKTLTLLTSLVTFLFTLCNFKAQAQDLPEEEEKKERFTLGAISPAILEKGGVELNFNNAMASFWTTSSFGQNVIDRTRSTVIEQSLNVSYGFSQNRTWDLGAEIRYTHFRFDENARSSPFKIFESDSPTSQTYRSFTSFGARLRVAPFEQVSGLTFQGTVSFPIAGETDREALNAERIQTAVGATFFQEISSGLHFFMQARWRTLFSNQDNDYTTHLPDAGLYLVADLFDRKIYVFPGLSYAASFQRNYNGGRLRKTGEYVFGNLGVQFQPVDAFGIFVFGQKPFYLEAGDIFYEVVRSSYFTWVVGMRGIF